MWGTRLDRCRTRPLNRFIPTHVGNTRSSTTAALGSAVHPHACGEHSACTTSRDRALGSSPRMWGTRREGDSQRFQPRFIPTHVGNTIQLWRPRFPASVHPHACGEHLLTNPDILHNTGSSPRMWGTLSSRECENGSHRFIPTHVGNTRMSGFVRSAMTVHPHACGEHERESR